MLSTLCIIAAILIVPQTLAFEVGSGPCPRNLTAVGDLKMDRMEGKWYAVFMYPELSKKVPKCKSINISLDDNNQYSMIVKSIDHRFGTVKMLTQKFLKIEPQNGRYVLATRNKGFPNGVQVSVLDTDYEGFSVHYMCFDADNVIHFQWATIYTRTRMPNVNVIHAAKTLAQFSGLDVDKFIRIPQEACPMDT